MTYDRVNYEQVDAVNDAMHFLRDPLDAESIGVTVVDCEPGWTGMEHDHAEGDHEEVYLLIDGEATLTVDGEDVDMTAGDAVRIPPGVTRQLRNGDEESLFVLAGAP